MEKHRGRIVSRDPCCLSHRRCSHRRYEPGQPQGECPVVTHYCLPWTEATTGGLARVTRIVVSYDREQRLNPDQQQGLHLRQLVTHQPSRLWAIASPSFPRLPKFLHTVLHTVSTHITCVSKRECKQPLHSPSVPVMLSNTDCYQFNLPLLVEPTRTYSEKHSNRGFALGISQCVENASW